MSSTPVDILDAARTQGTTPEPRAREAFVRPLYRAPSKRLDLSRIVLASLLLALSIFVAREGWLDIVALAWHDSEYSHIFIVPFIAVFLVWVRRLRLRHFRVSGNVLGLALLACGVLLYNVGMNTNTQLFFHGGPVLMAVGAVSCVLGKGAVLRFLPAIVVLAFLIPFPGRVRLDIAAALQFWTAQISQVLLQVVGIETQVRGFTLDINGQTVAIAEACNGMRMVFPLFLISFAFAFGMPLRAGIRVLLILLSPVVAIACNVARTLPTIYIYGQDAALGKQFHDLSGWAMLPIAFLILLGVIKALRWTGIPVQKYTLASQ